MNTMAGTWLATMRCRPVWPARCVNLTDMHSERTPRTTPRTMVELVRVEPGREPVRLIDAVAVEHLLELEVHGPSDRRVVGLRCSPSDLEDLVVGWLIGQGLLSAHDAPAAVMLTISEDLRHARVGLSTRGGLPGDPPRHPGEAGRSPRVGLKPGFVAASVALLDEAPLFRETGAGHSAAAVSLISGRGTVREDIGRRNALDKVIGSLWWEGRLADGAEPHLLAISGRVWSDAVAKAVRAGIPVLASRGAPTLEAVTEARRAGITLVGFVRGGAMNVYSGLERLDLGVGETDRV